MIDPGLGFAKEAQHDLDLVAGLADIRALGWPVLVGGSRQRSRTGRHCRPIAGTRQQPLCQPSPHTRAPGPSASTTYGPSADEVRVARAVTPLA